MKVKIEPITLRTECGENIVIDELSLSRGADPFRGPAPDREGRASWTARGLRRDAHPKWNIDQSHEDTGRKFNELVESLSEYGVKVAGHGWVEPISDS